MKQQGPLNYQQTMATLKEFNKRNATNNTTHAPYRVLIGKGLYVRCNCTHCQ